MKNDHFASIILKELNNVPEEYAREHMERTMALLDSREEQILSNIFADFTRNLPPDLTDEEKAVLLYEVITRETHYDYLAEKESRFIFVGALLSHQAVCMGIAELYALLCSFAGLTCKIIIGYAWNETPQQGSLHAWNIIRLKKDGREQWYHCDATWDLKELQGPGDEYLLKSDAYMKEHHHFWLPDRYPSCPENAGCIIKPTQEEVISTCHILKKATACALDRKTLL